LENPIKRTPKPTETVVLENWDHELEMKNPLIDGIKRNNIKAEVLNIANYHKTLDDETLGKKAIDRLVEDLEKLKPTHLAIAWCYSSNDDLVMALRARGFFSKMLLNHDLRNITDNPDAKLNDDQINVLRRAHNMDINKIENRHFLIAGGKGSGKTILACEVAKIIFAKLDESGKECRFRVILNTYHTTDEHHDEPSFLRGEMISKYFQGFGIREEDIQLIRSDWSRDMLQEQVDNFDNENESTVVIFDDAHVLQLKKLGLNVQNTWIIGCTSRTEEASWLTEVSADLARRSWHNFFSLKESYRYTPVLAEFLSFASKKVKSDESVPKPTANLKDYPQPLKDFKHPVVWIRIMGRVDHDCLGIHRTDYVGEKLVRNVKQDLQNELKKLKKPEVSVSDLLHERYNWPDPDFYEPIERNISIDEGYRHQAIRVNIEGSEFDVVVVRIGPMTFADHEKGIKSLIGTDIEEFRDEKTPSTNPTMENEKEFKVNYIFEKISRARKQLFMVTDDTTLEYVVKWLQEAVETTSEFREGDPNSGLAMKIEVSRDEFLRGEWLDKVKAN